MYTLHTHIRERDSFESELISNINRLTYTTYIHIYIHYTHIYKREGFFRKCVVIIIL